VTLAAETGALVGRRLVFSDDDDEFISAEVEPGGYLRVVIRFAFGETLFGEGAP
jgi:hypothetical protein